MRSNNKSYFSLVSSHKLIRTISQVQKPGIISTLTVSMVTKIATKIG